MGDIIKAIEVEKEYLECRMKNEEPFHLVDKIKECGFEDLNDYFVIKKMYSFGRMNFQFIEKDPVDCIEEVLRMINENVTGVLFVNSNETFVFNGSKGENSFNEDYCIENNIPIYPIQTGGGTIVSTTGDFSLGICVPKDTGINTLFILNRLKNILTKYTDKNIVIDNNDILVDGKKVCGSAIYSYNGMFMFVGYFSFNDKSELIRNICANSNSIKEPSYIDFMLRDDFRNEVTAWLQELSI